MITALCGGVGGSKLVLGLYRTLPPDELTVIVNTADDTSFFGLHVSPDLDTVTYTLAGLAQRDAGWGIEGDTFHALEMLRRYGEPSWFQVGDSDLATHIFRTQKLREGTTLTEVTEQLAAALGVRAPILPMSDDPVATLLRTGNEWMDFQEYFVHRRHRDPVAEIRYQGVAEAAPGRKVLQAIASADTVILVNSNPVLSIFPILSLPGVREQLTDHPGVVAVSPIVGAGAVSGPAGRLMNVIGHRATALGVAEAYRGVIGGIVIDRVDEAQTSEIEMLGIRVRCAEIIMRTLEDRERVAHESVALGEALE